jgi:hypothetical protein
LNETEKIYEYTKQIDSNPDVFNPLLKAFFADGPQYDEYRISKKFPTYLSCRFNLDIFNDYFKCIGYITWDPEEYAYKLMNILTGSWFVKLEEN